LADAAHTGHFRGDGTEDVHVCTPDSICAGDGPFAADPETSAQVRGFLSFDLSPLPHELTRLVDARLNVASDGTDGDPFAQLGQLHIERATFASVGQAAFDAAPRATFGVMTADEDSASVGNLLWGVQADWQTTGLNQYRLSFDRGSNRDD